MDAQELRKLESGDLAIIDGRIVVIESVDEHSITYWTSSISFVDEREKQTNKVMDVNLELFQKMLGKDENEKDEADKGDQPSHQDVIG